MSMTLNISDDFFQDEERAGYLVSAKMKRIWAVELDLLCQLDRICQKHNLTYSASGGTLLGAIRHKGFIPWDDDIDVVMERDQYEKLCQVAPAELEEPYFFQTEYTDPGSFRGHAQLRNSKTTGILSSEAPYRLPINQGIFIDIFPLDKVVDDPEKMKEQIANAKAYLARAKQLYLREYQYQQGDHSLKKTLWHMYTRVNKKAGDHLAWYHKFEEECAKYNNTDAEFCTLFSFAFDDPRHFKRCEDVKQPTLSPFEMTTMPVQANYEDVLTVQFGQWKEFVVGGSIHGGIIFDTEISYREYINGEMDLPL